MKTTKQEAAFKLNKEAGADGTSLRGNVTISPKRLTEVFGQPSESDGYKVSGDYTFTSHSGDVFNLYDWKLTNLYDPDLISPEDFWNQTSPITFNIGAKRNACIAEFKSFLEQATKNEVIKAADNAYRVAVEARDAFEAATKLAQAAYDTAIAAAHAIYRAARKEGALK